MCYISVGSSLTPNINTWLKRFFRDKNSSVFVRSFESDEKKSFSELIPDGAVLPDDEVVHLGLDVVHLRQIS